ncbi:flavocytochrome c [Oribacterium sp. KHPX15]|uniref:FAD-dependent oxidoreductase n=1 Tax=Oribacterium sp. KHPX15 TaxID=1855342 RepID=UPI000898E8E1|nr:FAD-dependent oxidoreductase [Oribacterium sp. KHPX15]SDZ88559.1 flavocytochrome c [Oribacterium sp. KHPX15]
MRKSKALIAGLAASIALTACGSTTTPPAATEAAKTEAAKETTAAAETTAAGASEGVSGEFEGTAPGMQGPVTVKLTVENGQITKVDLTEISETDSLTTVAKERIPAQIVEHQTTKVDAVTGATLCSNAIMSAARKAAEEAGLDLTVLDANEWHAEAGADETYDQDVVVVGGGGAGLSAAISAAQQGAKVTLIEKGSVLGGDTMMAGGAFNAVDPEAQAERVMSVAEKNTLDEYLALKADDPDLHFDQFPEWKQVLTDLQDDLTKFFKDNEGKEAGKDMPGYDSIPLHMWHIYTGGLREMNDGSWVASNIDLARNLAENALDSYDWTGDLGIETASHKGAGETLYTVLGAMWPRTHAYQNGAPLIEALKAAADKEGVTIYTETAGKSLITDADGKVVGVNAEKADGTKVTLNASKGVVLACGGYCANPAMVKEYDKYWGDDLTDHTLTTNVGTNTGDGIVMAQEVGADTVDMGVSQLMPSSSPVKGTMTDGIWADASEQIWIDGEGNRFVNEYAERDVLAKASLGLDDGIFYIIYAGSSKDTGKCEGADPSSSLFGNTVEHMVETGHVWYGSTLAELAEATKTAAAGVAPAFTEEALRETIEKYNSYVENQADPDFGKGVLAGAIDLEAIESNPDVGIVISPRKASLHHTMGGIVINTDGQVVNEDGEAITGLFAAGEVTGGVHGGNRLGGNAIADIFTYGRIAGKNVATQG